jgi:beta-ribofuranosylaminobenzene 5'-phosphate synthase
VGLAIAESLTVTAPSRVHLGLLQLSTEFANSYGGLGAAISAPHWTLEVRVTQPPDQLAGFGRELGAYARGLLSRVREQFDLSPLAVKARTRVPSHVGLGSKTSLGCALLAAAYALGRPGEDWFRHRNLLNRGGASGIGINVSVVGGLVLDAGHPRESSAFLLPSGARLGQPVPAVVARWSAAFLPAPLLVRPHGVRGLYGAQEIRFWRRHTPIDASSAMEAAALLMYEVLPSIARQDVEGWLRGIQAFQTCGFKRLEWELQPDSCHVLRKAAYAAGASAVALSGMGPTLVVFAADSERVAATLRATVGASVTRAEFTDVGVAVRRSPDCSSFAGRGLGREIG